MTIIEDSGRVPLQKPTFFAILDSNQCDTLSFPEAISWCAKAEEEALIYILGLRRFQNSKAWVNRLPAELLVQILLYLVPPEAYEFQAWIHLTHVCSYWRNVALRRPKFWTHVDLTQEACARTFLERSADAEIHIYWMDGPGDLRILSHLCHHADRIASITVKEESRDVTPILAMLNFSLPSLRAMTICANKYTASGNREGIACIPGASDSQRLTSLSLHSLVIPWTSTLYAGLQHLELRNQNRHWIQPSLTEFLDILDACPGLVTLTVALAGPTFGRTWERTKRMVQLRNCRCLTIHNEPHDVAGLLSLLVLPATASLEVCAPADVSCRGDELLTCFPSNRSHMGAFSCVTRLSVTFRIGHVPKMVQLTATKPSETSEEVSISAGVQGATFSYNVQPFQAFFSTIGTLFAQSPIEELNVDGDIGFMDDLDWYGVLGKFKKLTRLEIGSKDMPVMRTNTSLDVLRDLCTPDFSWQSLACSDLSQLMLYFRTDHWESDLLPMLRRTLSSRAQRDAHLARTY
ncbi:unnamed protein product [Somion occarium]|uniref:F-box domain-containing protein n=1 Tax=Somion occarium TaxID=3059160 RepID=A0ABP1E5Z4_9APHY